MDTYQWGMRQLHALMSSVTVKAGITCTNSCPITQACYAPGMAAVSSTNQTASSPQMDL